MRNFHWSVEDWGSAYPPENADEIIDKANEMIDEFAKTHEDEDDVAVFCEKLWERYCATEDVL